MFACIYKRPYTYLSIPWKAKEDRNAKFPGTQSLWIRERPARTPPPPPRRVAIPLNVIQKARYLLYVFIWCKLKSENPENGSGYGHHVGGSELLFLTTKNWIWWRKTNWSEFTCCWFRLLFSLTSLVLNPSTVLWVVLVLFRTTLFKLAVHSFRNFDHTYSLFFIYPRVTGSCLFWRLMPPRATHRSREGTLPSYSHKK